MEGLLVREASDAVDEFRLRKPGNNFLKKIVFKSSKPLSQAKSSDLSLSYKGTTDRILLDQLFSLQYEEIVAGQSRIYTERTNKASFQRQMINVR